MASVFELSRGREGQTSNNGCRSQSKPIQQRSRVRFWSERACRWACRVPDSAARRFDAELCAGDEALTILVATRQRFRVPRAIHRPERYHQYRPANRHTAGQEPYILDEDRAFL